MRARLRHAILRGMGITFISSHGFNQDAGGAKRAAERGPVVITDRGRPAHVLLRYADYERLLGRGRASPMRSPCRAATISTSSRRA